MATTYNNCQMGIVDVSGNLSVIYPQTKASLVSCDSATYGGSSNVTNVQSALNNLSSAVNTLDSKLNTIDQVRTTSNGNAKYYKNGKMVYVSFAAFTYLANYTVPEGYRPIDSYTYTVLPDTSGKQYVHMQINSNGSIVVRNSSDTILSSYKLYGTVCYLIP